MSARTKSRKRALDVLFAADVRGSTPAEALAAEAQRAAGRPERSSSWPYARDLVEGVIEHRDEIDALIVAANTSTWTLDRMPAVDRAALRIAVWELAHNPEVPYEVAIAEAVEIVKELSTEDSPRFVNGVLMGIAKQVRQLS